MSGEKPFGLTPAKSYKTQSLPTLRGAGGGDSLRHKQAKEEGASRRARGAVAAAAGSADGLYASPEAPCFWQARCTHRGIFAPFARLTKDGDPSCALCFYGITVLAALERGSRTVKLRRGRQGRPAYIKNTGERLVCAAPRGVLKNIIASFVLLLVNRFSMIFRSFLQKGHFPYQSPCPFQ